MEQFDIVPELKKKIESAFKDLVNNDRVLSSLSEKIQSGKGTYEDAHNFAGELAKCLQQAFQAHLSADQLPNGRFYYNMASRIIPDSLKTNHRMISEACVSVQESLNDSAGLHIQAQTAPVNQDRISGLVYRVSQDDFDKTKWLLDSPIENFCRSVVDDHAKANADFHYRSGLRPKIIRRTAGKCCKWCSDLAGSYDYYPDMNRDVFRRHDNCRCTVVYDPAHGSRRVQDVWTKHRIERIDKESISNSTVLESPLGNKPVLITDQAIDKVKNINIEGLEEKGDILKREHRKLLEFARRENGSKEVTGVIRNFNLGEKEFVYAKGDWDRTNLDANPDIQILFATSPPESLIVIHNHPNSNSFSYADLGVFAHSRVKTLTLITNKGVVRALNKTNNFNYRVFISIIKEEKEKWGFTKTMQPVIVKNVLKRAAECNLEYIK